MRRLYKVGIGFAVAIIILLVAFIGTNAVLESGAKALKAGDDNAALQRLRILAFVGNTTAQELVGTMYAFGWGVPKNDDEAIRWFRRAGHGAVLAEDPAAVAEYYVGDSFANGVQVAKSDENALKWFQRSANGGYAKAQELLATAYEKGLYGLTRDSDQARYWRARAARTEVNR